MYPSLTKQPAFAAHPGAAVALPHARAAAAGGLFLPSASAYTDGTVDLVADLIRLFLGDGPSDAHK